MISDKLSLFWHVSSHFSLKLGVGCMRAYQQIQEHSLILEALGAQEQGSKIIFEKYPFLAVSHPKNSPKWLFWPKNAHFREYFKTEASDKHEVKYKWII